VEKSQRSEYGKRELEGQNHRKTILQEKHQNRSKKLVKIQKVEEEELLREVTVKIGLEKVEMKEEILMEIL